MLKSILWQAGFTAAKWCYNAITNGFQLTTPMIKSLVIQTLSGLALFLVLNMSGALLPESMVDAQPGKLLYIYALHYGFILIAFFAFIASSIDLITRTYRTYTGLKS